ATSVPEVSDLTSLDKFLTTLPPDRKLLWCDEAMVGQAPALSGPRSEKWAILIGPEGGFSSDEQTRLRALPQIHPTALGPRILRADTAVVAAITLWQAALGDWA
ncbi:MAG: RsmE family RNA methyltransferase, partial [Cypionkella sp.]